MAFIFCRYRLYTEGVLPDAGWAIAAAVISAKTAGKEQNDDNDDDP